MPGSLDRELELPLNYPIGVMSLQFTTTNAFLQNHFLNPGNTSCRPSICLKTYHNERFFSISRSTVSWKPNLRGLSHNSAKGPWNTSWNYSFSLINNQYAIPQKFSKVSHWLSQPYGNGFTGPLQAWGFQFAEPVVWAQVARTKRRTPRISSGLYRRIDRIILSQNETNPSKSCNSLNLTKNVWN